MIRKIAVFAIAFCAYSSVSLAQESKSGNFFGYIPKMKISVLSPLGLIDPRSFAEVSFEHKIGNRNSLEYSGGVYLPNSAWQSSGNSYSVQQSGFRLRANYKVYFSQYDYNKNQNGYVAPELLFNYFKPSSTGWFDRYDNAYQQFMTIKRRATAIGVGIILGQQLYFSNAHDFFADLYFGLGYRSLQISGDNIPEDIDLEANRGSFGFLVRNEGAYFHPYFIMGCKMGIVLKK